MSEMNQDLRTLRHSASHVLAEAVKRLYPNAKLAIGPAIEDGFYYDFECDPFSREDLDAIEKEMKKISYRGNLIEEFKDDDAVYSKIQHIKTDAKGLRQIAEIVEEYGYSIYHLTQL